MVFAWLIDAITHNKRFEIVSKSFPLPRRLARPFVAPYFAHDVAHPIIVHGVLTLSVCLLFVPSLR